MTFNCLYRQILTFFLLACKFNEDFQLPKQYILEFWRNTKAVSLQSDLNKWEAGWLMAIDNNLFVKENQYLSKMHSLQLSSNAFGLKSYSLIENYFPEPKINKGKCCFVILKLFYLKSSNHFFSSSINLQYQIILLNAYLQGIILNKNLSCIISKFKYQNYNGELKRFIQNIKVIVSISFWILHWFCTCLKYFF